MCVGVWYGGVCVCVKLSEYSCNLNEAMFGWRYNRCVHEVGVKGYLGSLGVIYYIV